MAFGVRAGFSMGCLRLAISLLMSYSGLYFGMALGGAICAFSVVGVEIVRHEVSGIVEVNTITDSSWYCGQTFNSRRPYQLLSP